MGKFNNSKVMNKENEIKEFIKYFEARVMQWA
jgi:hypothetical protein